MAICRSCQSYYKKNQWNQSDECSDCAYTVDVPLFDEEDSLEVEHLFNPSGGHYRGLMNNVTYSIQFFFNA